MGVPLVIIHLSRIFHEINHPASLGCLGYFQLFFFRFSSVFMDWPAIFNHPAGIRSLRQAGDQITRNSIIHGCAKGRPGRVEGGSLLIDVTWIDVRIFIAMSPKPAIWNHMDMVSIPAMKMWETKKGICYYCFTKIIHQIYPWNCHLIVSIKFNFGMATFLMS